FNYIYANLNAGILPGCCSVKIWNNTIYGTSGGSGIDIQPGWATDSIIRNNLVIGNGDGTPAQQIVNGNGTPAENITFNLTNDTAANCFNNAAAGDFTLKPTCTNAIHQGTPNIATGITIPACGTPLCFHGVAPDIGAFETGGGATPLTDFDGDGKSDIA